LNRVIYPGSFDPVTLGHLDLITRAREVFDSVIVAVTNNREKKPIFSIEERVELIREVTKDIEHIEVESFEGLLVDYAISKDANAILRGLRAISDFEFEFQMALTNKKLCPQINTIFMMASEEYSYLSSSIIKEITALKGDVSAFVPAPVARRIVEKFALRSQDNK